MVSFLPKKKKDVDWVGIVQNWTVELTSVMGAKMTVEFKFGVADIIGLTTMSCSFLHLGC